MTPHEGLRPILPECGAPTGLGILARGGFA
jgi:hypothetical protein